MNATNHNHKWMLYFVKEIGFEIFQNSNDSFIKNKTTFFVFCYDFDWKQNENRAQSLIRLLFCYQMIMFHFYLDTFWKKCFIDVICGMLCINNSSFEFWIFQNFKSVQNYKKLPEKSCTSTKTERKLKTQLMLSNQDQVTLTAQ